jgi:hypothetical protein
MQIKVRICHRFQKLTDGTKEVVASGKTIAEVLIDSCLVPCAINPPLVASPLTPPLPLRGEGFAVRSSPELRRGPQPNGSGEG